MNTDQITPTPTPTPRTDAAIEHLLDKNGHVIFRIHPKVCARLEVELAAERALADRLADALKQCLCGYTYDSDRVLAAWKEDRGA